MPNLVSFSFFLFLFGLLKSFGVPYFVSARRRLDSENSSKVAEELLS
jgi:hypothetical protein